MLEALFARDIIHCPHVHMQTRLLDAAWDAKHLPEAIGRVRVKNVVELNLQHRLQRCFSRATERLMAVSNVDPDALHVVTHEFFAPNGVFGARSIHSVDEVKHHRHLDHKEHEEHHQWTLAAGVCLLDKDFHLDNWHGDSVVIMTTLSPCQLSR